MQQHNTRRENTQNTGKNTSHSRKFLSEMRPSYNNGAFTLIELLVVVLIISILAAVALPQYQKAVRKARMAEVGAIFSNVSHAIDMWLLENGGYPKRTAHFFGTEKDASLNIDLACDGAETTTLCPIDGVGALSADCNDDICNISIHLSSEVPGLTSTFSKSGDRISWASREYGPWKLSTVLTADPALRKQICQWWTENYGVELLVGTAADEQCK